MAEKFIQAMHMKKGAFTAQAKKAGASSTMAYAQEKKSAGGTTGRRARLAITLSRLSKRKGGRSSSRSSGRR
jgi:hypothetical protein